MKSIGFRCWKDRFAFVVLEGTQEAPTLVAKELRRSPQNVSRPEFLAWVRRNVYEILTAHLPDAVSFRAHEPVSRMKDLHRAEVEGVLQEAAYGHSPSHLTLSRVKIQIKKDIVTFDRPARYLGYALVDANLADLKSVNFEDAALVAVCGLPPS